MPDAPKPDASPAEPQDGNKKAFPTKLVAAIAGLMLVEAVGFVLLAPSIASSQPDVADQIESQAAATQRDASKTDLEVEIGAFNVTNSVARPDTTLHMTFHVHVQVPPDLVEEMKQRLAPRRNRVEQAVEIIARGATIKDIEDATLYMVKKRIRDELNEILGNQYVTGVIIRKFQHFES